MTPPDVHKYATFVRMSLEARADAGLPLTEDEIVELDRRQAGLDAFTRSWRYRLRSALLAPFRRLRHVVCCQHGEDEW